MAPFPLPADPSSSLPSSTPSPTLPPSLSLRPTATPSATLVSEANPLGLDGKTIAGIVVAILFAAALVGGIAYWLVSWHRSRKRRLIVPALGHNPHIRPTDEKHAHGNYRRMATPAASPGVSAPPSPAKDDVRVTIADVPK